MATRAIDSRNAAAAARTTARTDGRGDVRARRYDPAETKNRVLSAAYMLFSTKGFASTGTADIARAADVSEGSIFYHFGSKKALLVELGRRHGELMIEAMEAGYALEDLEPGIIIPRVLQFCRENLMWEGMGGTADMPCGGPGPKAALQGNADAEPFYHAAKTVTTNWIAMQMTAAMAKRGITGVAIDLAASFTHHVVGDAIDLWLTACTPAEADRVERETVRFVRAACNYPTD
ncbi:TetR/AcrR family transcriptional regulator [Sandarakinorhabdus sp.]|uniref:TetR/AcrR family transcriptional regulator n=1 Tax=Sandarakinorhabdus sp. TaxID=1916663 RepID=UPI00286E5828|nr:TetR/AcrR family transcriptional regulator [Sandarakinorhabdus sp.]